MPSEFRHTELADWAMHRSKGFYHLALFTCHLRILEIRARLNCVQRLSLIVVCSDTSTASQSDNNVSKKNSDPPEFECPILVSDSSHNVNIERKQKHDREE